MNNVSKDVLIKIDKYDGFVKSILLADLTWSQCRGIKPKRPVAMPL
jgi:hypothetical protein